ncbi:MAG: quinolinate synthase NadA [Bacteroidia bacterium]|nr:quinolinate synthase NadA [Bacteroidia bacterium]
MKEKEKLVRKILELKKIKNAVILVHNYQRPEIYEVADYIGDSLELSRKAAETDADIIVFCGVKFMAETAKILSPNKKVLLPEIHAECSLADMITPEDVHHLKNKFPDAAVVCYVNTSAEVKALCDVCCTSANAVKVVNALPNKQIIFLPDKNLGRYVQSKSNKEIILWEGYCSVHQELSEESLLQFKGEHPGSKIIAHPECSKEILNAADFICGTGGMAKFAEQDAGGEYIVVTECGMTNKLRQDVPGKQFYSFCNLCHYMKMTTLGSVATSLDFEMYEITLPDKIILNAKQAVDRMLELS